MTETQRLLALDAALCAFGGVQCSTETRGAFDLLQIAISNEIDNNDDIPPIFGMFLKAQREAVRALANSPEVFGAKSA